MHMAYQMHMHPSPTKHQWQFCINVQCPSKIKNNLSQIIFLFTFVSNFLQFIVLEENYAQANFILFKIFFQVIQ